MRIRPHTFGAFFMQKNEIMKLKELFELGYKVDYVDDYYFNSKGVLVSLGFKKELDSGDVVQFNTDLFLANSEDEVPIREVTGIELHPNGSDEPIRISHTTPLEKCEEIVQLIEI